MEQSHAWASPCGICGGQIGTETGFSQNSSMFPCQYHPTMALHARISPGDEQQARWKSQFRDIISPHQHEQLNYHQ
jgi:hypothetical protein